MAGRLRAYSPPLTASDVAVTVQQIELGIQSLPKGRHPAHGIALGTVMLAHQTWEEVEDILREHAPGAKTPARLVEPPDIRRELARVARCGYGVAAVSISGPQLRSERDRVPAVAEHVMANAEKGSMILGAPG